MSNWYEKGREVLRAWAATSPSAADGARMAPLGRALDVVDAGDVLVALVDEYFDHLNRGGGTHPDAAAWVESMARIQAACAAYHQKRGPR